MTITLEEARELLSGSPQDNQFRAAVGTLNTYNTQNRELSGLKSGIVSGTYAEGENWNPGQLIGDLGKYTKSLAAYLEGRDKVVEADSLLGPVYSDWLAGMSKNIATMKSRIVTRFNYEAEKAVFDKVSAENLKTAATAGDKAAGDYMKTLENLTKELHGIN